MTAGALLKPELYAEGPQGPTLKGGSCRCGYVFFPFQSYGCEQCGAVGSALTPTDLAGEGRLVSSAVVYVHRGEGRRAPFVVGAVRLKAGPVVRTLLDASPDDVPPLPDTPMTAVLVPVTGADNQPARDLRFRAS